ncbi:MAG TPA: N-formylglutamate deformylase [Candidatus Angelobacter sp.]|nr:N-formylglutamate deformylase [Candidatus Angelobacter sp.]
MAVSNDAIRMDIYRFAPGRTPLLVSMPHVGTHIPDALARRMTDGACGVPDTDWHVDRLYDFLGGLGAAVIQATHSRYVIDLNRPPDSAPLYPGAANTGLCPTEQFDGQPLYKPGETLGDPEVQDRLQRYWRPYHDRLAAELQALHARHGIALLFEAHTIRSRVPRLFDGRLPDINLGTADGKSCASDLAALLIETAGEAEAYSSILNGRFKGGYITRRYGRPVDGVHAVQLELAQLTYMDEDPPYGFREDLAIAIRPTLNAIVQAMISWGSRR